MTSNSDSIYRDMVKNMLYSWGRWGRNRYEGLGYKPPGWTQLVSTTRRSTQIDILDTEAEAVDKLISSLTESEPHLRQVAIWYYVVGLTDRDTAKKIHRSKTMVQNYRKQLLDIVCQELPDKLT